MLSCKSMTQTPLEANRMRWTREPGHYEVWYATLSHPESRTGFWIRYTLEAPFRGHGAPYAQLWFARFSGPDPRRTFAFNRKVGADQLESTPDPFRVRIGEAELKHDGMRGALDGDGHQVSWDLRWTPSETVHLHLPPSVYRGTWADTQVLSPNLNVAAHGHITVDGERYELAGAPLGQTHLWGKKHAYSWAWAHCNAFEGDPGATLEALTIRLRRGPIVLPKLTLLALDLEGDDPSHLAFTHFLKLPLARSDYATGRYHLWAVSAQAKVEVELTCRPEDMVLAEYVDPDGDPAFCHNTCSSDARVRIWRRSPFVGRFREHRTLTAAQTAHWEWGARAGDPLVKKRHVSI